MCFLIEWVVFISIIQVAVIVDDVGILIPVIQGIFVDVSQILFVIVIVFKRGYIPGVRSYPVPG